MKTPHLANVSIIGYQRQASFRASRMGYFVTNGMEPRLSPIAITCTLAVALHVAVYAEGTSDQQINSGSSELVTKQNSQLQRNSPHLGISPSHELSDLKKTRGCCSHIEELTLKRNRLVPFIPF